MATVQMRFKRNASANSSPNTAPAPPNCPRGWRENLPEGFTDFSQPEAQRRRLRTSNACENLNRQVRRRTAVAGLFPNEASLLRLVSALLMEIAEDWETSKCYLSPLKTTTP